MKVEVVTIGNELLLNDILDTNSAYAVRCLREMNIPITCRVTVGDDPSLIADTMRTALARADVVITSGGLGSEHRDYTVQAAALASERTLIVEAPWISGGIVLGGAEVDSNGLLLETKFGTLICLPGQHRDMMYLFETKVLPYLQERLPTKRVTGWILLRTAGIMESNIRQQLGGILQRSGERLSYNSFAGQTDIRITVEADSPDAVDKTLDRLSTEIYARLGDHIYGENQARLEQVLVDQLNELNLNVALAECGTDRALAQTLERIEDASNVFSILRLTAYEEIEDYLQLEPLATESDLTQWCRQAAEALRRQTGTELALLLYNNFTQSGVQILVTLASPTGVTMMQRSFGGHPGNIDQWAGTLGLVNLRRWLLAHHSRETSELDLA